MITIRKRRSFMHPVSLLRSGPVRALCLMTLTMVVALAGTIAATADEVWSQEREIAELQRQIEENGWCWTAGPTSVNAVPPEEREGFTGQIPLTPEEIYEILSARAIGELEALPRDELPTSWDWRELGGMTPVKNQRACGSCWAFAAVGALESYYKITTGEQLLFSEKQCIRCNEYGYGCNGGNDDGCYDLWTWFGSVPQSCIPYYYPYEGPCEHSDCEIGARITGTTIVPNGIEYLKTAVMTHPVYIHIRGSGAIQSYTGGCFAGPNEGSDHAVLLCGWDDDACYGNGAWLIKNSWGTGWGESGYGWIQFGTSSLHGPTSLLHLELPPEALVAYRSHEVLGDRDGIILPGAEAQIAVTVTNYASGDASGVTGELTCLTPGVSVIDGTAGFSDMASWESATSAAPHFTIELDPTVDPGTLLEFALVMNSDQAADTSAFYEFVSGYSVIYAEGFEGGDGGWTHGATTGVDDWSRGVPRWLANHWDPKEPASGDFLFGNDLNNYTPAYDGLYPNQSTNYLQSPLIDCTDYHDVHLKFSRWLCAEESRWDIARILVNGTEIWTNPYEGHQLDRSWVPAIHDISAIADDNPSVRIRFELQADQAWKFGGWNVDDVQLISLMDPSGVDRHPSAPLALRLESPNPVLGMAHLQLEIPASATAARVELFDATGRSVRLLHDGDIEPGTHALRWSGCDASGQRLPAGAYYCRATCGTQSSVTQITLVR
ncbi:MAG: hypothetical protein GF330_02095 [Candidatus Eisenbacteria bacterium]|nr:hypothetical protein [Candidatus Eisenbacteria bacterium]